MHRPLREETPRCPSASHSLWQSVEERETPERFAERRKDEFLSGAFSAPAIPSRRQFMQLSAAVMGLGGLSACSAGKEWIVPQVRDREGLVLGRPALYATTLCHWGSASGVLVETHEGRPTKIEGNPDHPSSLGGSDVFSQAALFNLFDPDRSQAVKHRRQIATRTEFEEQIEQKMQTAKRTKGGGLRLLTGPVCSPTLTRQIGRLLDAYPRARWHRISSVAKEGRLQASRTVLGERFRIVERPGHARVILSLDSDFLAEGPFCVRYAREFAQRRRKASNGVPGNRLYALEAMPTATGATADHRLPVPYGLIPALVHSLGRKLGLPLEHGVHGAGLAPRQQAWIDAVAEDLQNNRGSSLVMAGPYQPPLVHVLALLVNASLENIGNTLELSEFFEDELLELEAGSLEGLAAELQSGRVEQLMVIGCNPAYSAVPELRFADCLAQVPFSVHLGLYEDETARCCDWHLPMTHELEMWSDARAWDGTASVVQPIVRPVYNGTSPHELLDVLLGKDGRTSRDRIRDTWHSQFDGPDFEAHWQRALHDGLLPQSAARPRRVSVRPLSEILAELPPAEAPTEDDLALEVGFRPDPTVGDGAWANNAWLQELPKPITTLTWENAVLMSPATAKALGLANEDRVALQADKERIAGPVWIVPGHAEGCVTLHLGYGREHAGKVGKGLGFDAGALRTARAPWMRRGVRAVKLRGRHRLAAVQHHHDMEGRQPIRIHTPATLPAERAGPLAGIGQSAPPGVAADTPQWGMVIDLSACTGCRVCTLACQAENNIPAVGKEEVLNGREMHWIRVDRYFEGEPAEPKIHHQPVPCMHCENAPCEPVCPVGATVHSAEGLNEMVYNRCVGTRYCSNNCPYKVRRFNFHQYADLDEKAPKLRRNPDVTVRALGVMEKCTYCVQRINAARIEAKKEQRSIRDGEVVPACMQACPSEAIVFGNIGDAKSRVSKERSKPHHYGLLAELNTLPRTTYLGRIRNPHPRLEGAPSP